MAELADDEKRCPVCAEAVKAAAIRCRFCNHDFTGRATPPKPVQAAPAKQPSGCSTLIAAGLAIGMIVFIASAITGNPASKAPEPVAAVDVMSPEQRKGCNDLLAEFTGPRMMVEHDKGMARVDADWWSGLPRDQQTQLINLVGCADFGVRLPGLRGDDQMVAIFDRRSNDIIAMASEGQRLK